MNIAVVGTGRMGRAVSQAAIDRDWIIHSEYDSHRPLLHSFHTNGSRLPDAVIDFSAPQHTLRHIRICCERGLPLVIGTTGWTEHLEEARRVVDRTGGCVLWAPNFSLGIALLSRALDATAQLLNRLPEFDISVHEVHHTGKKDSPSGTALRLAKMICDRINRKTGIRTSEPGSSYVPEELTITAARIGHEFGFHSIWIDGPADRLILSHEARSRQGFAEGALRAAEWLQGRTGFFTLEDMLDDMLTEDVEIRRVSASTKVRLTAPRT